MIGIINAMEIENNSILSLYKDIKEKTISGKKFYEATLAGEKVVCCLSGVAKVNAAISTTLLLEHFPIDCILNTGAAGGLKENENVLEAYDMTTEAVITKMMWILSITNKPSKIKKMFYTTIANDILFRRDI